MPYYVKVTPTAKEQILPDYVVKPKAKDGNYLLFQTDLIGIEGATLSDRVANVGGALLTPAECKAERLGTVSTPAECYTPVAFGGKGKVTSSESVSTASEGGSTGSTTEVEPAEVVIPSVINESQSTETSGDSEEEDSTSDSSTNEKESEVENG